MKRVLFVAVGFILIYVAIIAAHKATGKKVYTITVHTFGGDETYIATNYSLDTVTKCVTFRTLIGFKRTVCNNFSITEY